MLLGPNLVWVERGGEDIGPVGTACRVIGTCTEGFKKLSQESLPTIIISQVVFCIAAATDSLAPPLFLN
jgi:hypothetical protein